jgi:L-xylulose reductase
MRTAVVTGASPGIGKGIVLAVLADGCRVIALSRSAAKLDALASEVASDLLVTEALDVADTEPGAAGRRVSVLAIRLGAPPTAAPCASSTIPTRSRRR